MYVYTYAVICCVYPQLIIWRYLQKFNIITSIGCSPTRFKLALMPCTFLQKHCLWPMYALLGTSRHFSFTWINLFFKNDHPHPRVGFWISIYPRLYYLVVVLPTGVRWGCRRIIMTIFGNTYKPSYPMLVSPTVVRWVHRRIIMTIFGNTY